MENEEILSEEDFEKMKNLGISDAELDNLKRALALSDLASAMPQDIDAFMKKVEDYFPADGEQALIKYFELAKTDPDFFAQFVAYQEFLGVTDEPIETTNISDALRQINEETDPEKQDQMKHTLLVALGSAKGEEKENYVFELKNLLTLEEKQQLAEILKNR